MIPRRNSSSQYTYVDNTEKERREAEEKEVKRLENERKLREIEEELRIQKEREEEEEKLRKELRQQRKKELLEEELRREEENRKHLRLDVELRRRRDRLFRYKFGDKNRLDNFKGLDIDDVTQLRIGVFGPTGSGKSCFINTCERVVRQTDKGSVPDNTRGGKGTITLQDYLPELFFHLVDTRGFFYYHANEIVEFQKILYGKTQPGDNIACSAEQQLHKCPAFGQGLHGVIMVVRANDIRLREGDLRDYLQPVRDILRKNGIVHF
ncbi:hypothetical protein AWC38_SpisGene20053 [Stylophora pistillata]|uniref:Interferon-induced protein 44 n=1 Tax=Stylophora pistillata TaxID=50429 RepID=A0A2B4RGV8_STYPI|nr:hypothetical protein AWC38_SpisGene20053 [Stylophora pistillata]